MQDRPQCSGELPGQQGYGLWIFFGNAVSPKQKYLDLYMSVRK